MKLKDLYLAEIKDCTTNHQKEVVWRYWRRACAETLYDRSLVPNPIGHRRKTEKYIARNVVFWSNIGDEELSECLTEIDRLVF